MSTSDEILETAAQDGSIDTSEWPRVLETMLQKLHNIVHNEFSVPAIPVAVQLPRSVGHEVITSTPPPPPELKASQEQDADDEMRDKGYGDDDENQPPLNSQSSTKENDAPPLGRPPVPGFHSTPYHQAVQPSSGSIEGGPRALPPDLLSLFQNSTRMLEHDFAQSPPYTIQRLAEMVLYPRKHYKFLPAYLRALDRIISVTSPVSDFPLPSLVNDRGFLTNGDTNLRNGSSEREGLGSDESLGGALLTPIPWLRNNSGVLTGAGASGGSQDGELHSESTETIEGPNGAGSIETVTVTVNGVPSATSVLHTSPASTSTPASPTLSEQSDASTGSNDSTDALLRQQGGVTQGELLRQEQEAGVVPTSQQPLRRALISARSVAVGRESAVIPSVSIGPDAEDAPEDRPHARGPEEVGVEDMGPQPQHSTASLQLNMEAAVGRAKSPTEQPRLVLSSNTEMSGTEEVGEDRAVRYVEKEAEKLKEAKDSDGDVGVVEAADETTG